MNTDAIRTAASTAIPTALPVSYLAVLDFLSSPERVLGAIALLLQIAYVGVRLYKEMKAKNALAD